MTMLNRRNFLRTLAGAAVAAPALAVSGRAEAQEAYIVGVAADGWNVDKWQGSTVFLSSGWEHLGAPPIGQERTVASADCPRFAGSSGDELAWYADVECPFCDECPDRECNIARSFGAMYQMNPESTGNRTLHIQLDPADFSVISETLIESGG